MAQSSSTAAKRKNTTKKQTGKTQPSKKQNAGEEEKYIKTEKDIKIQGEVKLLLSLALTALLMISNFGLITPVGDYISYFMFGMTGISAYILPVLIFLSTAFLISNRGNRRAIVKFFAAVALFLFLLAMIQLIFTGYHSENNCFYYYFNCGENKNGGGFFGALIANGLCRVVGVVGAYILLLIFIIIACVVITERSFISGVKKGSKKVYTSAKEDVYKIRETKRENAREKEYQKNLRVHNVVKGVSLSRIDDPEKPVEEMHEITEESLKKVEPPEESPVIPEILNTSAKRRRKSMAERSQIMAKAELQPAKLKEPEGVEDGRVAYVYPEENDGVYESYDKRGNDIPKSFQQVVSRGPFVKNVTDIPVEKTASEEKYSDKVYIDEEGNYKAKEQIIVSESAKSVMNRPAFGGILNKPVTPAAVKETSEKSVGLGPDGAVEVAKADVENTVFEAEVVENTIPKEIEKAKKTKRFVLPRTNLLNKSQSLGENVNEEELEATADKLEEILKNFGVKASVTEFHRGPSVTRYEIQPEIGTRLNKITTLADDIKLNLAATDIRIEPIPGKSTIGIEVPNKIRESVLIRELIESDELVGHKSKIAFAAGKDIAGQVIVGDIAKMPHFLIAGTTGSGKSVFTNSIIMSILFRATPDEVRLIIVDPKVVEFGIYNGIPHLLQPVVTDARLASNTLKWAVAEMSDRYKKFAEFNVRDLKGYNEKVSGMTFMSEEERPKKLPQIVIVIDELADLMMVAAKEVEESICRLAQLARAAGIHLIIATQRPSVDVVTGLIKANIPSRCALMVSSGVDSRTIIDSVGAEKLLGNGDMLFYPSGYVKPVRLQGAFVSDAEVQRVVDFWTAQADGANYDDSIAEYVASQPADSTATQQSSGDDSGRDEYFEEAARLVVEKEKASTSMLQRVFKIGFNRAARIVEQLESAGIIGEEEGTKPRKVLVTDIELESILTNIK